MSNYIAARSMVLNGKTYRKGDALSICDQQFADLEPTGFVKVKPKAKAD